MSCTDADGNICKEELPIFTDNLPKEVLIQLLEEILAIQEQFKWFTAGKGNNNAANKSKLVVFFGRNVGA